MKIIKKVSTLFLSLSLMSCLLPGMVYAQAKNGASVFNGLPFKDALTIVKGNGSRKMAVFADPNCAPSMSFQRNLESVNNVTISVFVVPLKGDTAIALAKGIMCSEAPSMTWKSWMVNRVPPSTGLCTTGTLVSNSEEYMKLGIQSTPTTVFPDGSMLSGAAPASEVEKRLQMVYGAPAPLPSSRASVSSVETQNASPGGNSMFK